MARWLILAALLALVGCREQSAERPSQPSLSSSHPVPDAVPASSPGPENGPIVPESPVASEVPEASDVAEPPAAPAIPEPPVAAAVATPPSPPPASAGVRPAALAGSWYEGEATALREQISGYLKMVPESDFAGYPVALLVPHAGYRFSGPMAARAYRTLQGRTYGRVFVLGPAHRSALKGIAFPKGITHFETPLGRIPLALDVLEELRKRPLFVDHPSAHRQEHSIEIHLPFLQVVLPHGFELVPMVVAGLNRAEIEAVADALQQVMRPGDLLIASSDFTHYGERFSYLGPPGIEFGPGSAKTRLQELVDAAWKTISARDVEAFLSHKVETRDTICGYLPIALMLKVTPADTMAHLLGTDMSGRMTGGFAESVSYLSAAFTGMWPYSGTSGAVDLTADEKAALLGLARRQVEAYVRRQERLQVDALEVPLTPRLRADCGTFVTLKQAGRLRGCIGNIMPVKPLFQAVLDNAVNAAHFDRRFKPVQREELGRTRVEVSVLTPPVEQADWRAFVLGRDGIIVSKPEGSAVFLPQVAVEQGWTLEETLGHLSQKAGLGKDGWREGATFRTFEAIVFHEAP